MSYSRENIVRKQRLIRQMLHLVALGVLCGSLAPDALAQDEREKTFEFGLQLADMSGGTVNGTRGTSMDFSNDLAIGVVGGYNVTNRLSVGAELSWADPTYSLTRADAASGVIRGIDAEADIGTFMLKATFHFFDGAFTPYVEGGAGWMRVDSNVVSDVDTGCWWDPWWGYVCADFYETYSDTRTAYTYAAGVRWDLGTGMLLRASYGVIEMDTDNAAENIDLDTLRVELGWKF